jgi:putative transposase
MSLSWDAWARGSSSSGLCDRPDPTARGARHRRLRPGPVRSRHREPRPGGGSGPHQPDRGRHDLPRAPGSVPGVPGPQPRRCPPQGERVEDWLDLGQSLIRRGLRSLLLVVSDGAPGLIRAITELCPDADREAAPFIASGTSWPSCRSGQGSMSASGPPTGPRSMGQRRQLRPRPAFGSSSASSAASTRRSPPAWPTDVVAPTVHLAYPLRLRRRLRSTNLLERSLEEVRRRTKVIGRFPGETSCLTLARAVMDLVIAGDRSLGLTSPSATRSPPLVAARSVPQMEEQIAFDW